MFNSPGNLWLYFSFTLTVLCNVLSGEKLEILPTQPIQTKPVGKSLLLTCRPDVTNQALISEIQWRDNKGRIVEKAISGQTMPMYTEDLPFDSGVLLIITALTENMNGEYTCTANYASSEPLKATVQIKTIHPIKWVDAPENQFPVINSDYRIRCEVQANPAATVDWLKDGHTINTNEKYVVENKGMLIKNVQESDDGIYVCRAAVISTGELDNRYIKLEVQIPPRIEPIPSIEIVDGEQASVQCKAIGKPPPTYTWIKLSTKQDLSKTDRFSVNKNTGLLMINRVQQDDHSDYKCVAVNNADKVETTVKINVLVKPKVYDFVNITAPLNKETKIVCKASGRPLPKVTFKKYRSNTDYFVNGPQPNDNRIILEQEYNELKGETYGILTITQLKREDDGLYECLATNKGGEYRKNGHITVHFPPTFISSKNQPPVWSWNNKPGNLSCLAESIPNATIEWRLNEIVIENSPTFKIMGTGPQSFLIVNPYNEERLYTKYKCVARNQLGKAEHFVQLKRAFPPAPVQQAHVKVLTATTIQFEIVGPAVLDGLPVKAFTVQYKGEREVNWDTARNKTWSVDSPYILEDLEPEKTYVFRFAAHNEVGLGDWGATQTQTMSRRSSPGEPNILSVPEEGIVSSPYADHFLLRWKIPADNGEPIDNYQIKFCPVKRTNGNWNTIQEGCATEELSGRENPEFNLLSLSSDTHYKIELRAHNAIGYSTPAELIVKTARGSDTMVYNLDEPAISSAAIIGIVIAAIVILAIIVDLACYFNRAGILMAICERTRKNAHDEEDPKLGSEEREPLKPGQDHTSIVNNTMKKSSSVEYDGQRVASRTGEIIGKNSAV